MAAQAAAMAAQAVAMADEGGFLGRWSRRKQAVQQGRPLPPEPAAPAIAPAPAAASAPVPVPVQGVAPAVAAPRAGPADRPPPSAAAADAALPTLDDARALTPQSDFKPFVARGVAPEVRNAAMKKLFADPHFNVMDGLDVYIDDYSKPDPLPAAMLRKLSSARFLGLFDDEERQEQTPNQRLLCENPASGEPRDDADAPAAPAVAQSDPCPSLPSPPDSPVLPASQTDDAHPDLRLQPDHAAVRRAAGPGPE